ncbi:MAG: histidine kinase dimerization/phosphoacceptor domain -containing protein [Rhodospirillales bacterium]|nr:histidine kinase dimerization/phosphoacceptor domain -containing protein [Rhodospirillales bacterium]
MKNNFQIIASLLDLQASTEVSKESVKALTKSRQRVIVLARAYDHLYASKDLTHIGARDYLTSMVSGYAVELSAGSKNISLALAIEEITLGSDQAGSCGQIVSELISNSLSHAFPDGRSGTIEISLHRANENSICLAVSDDGIGLPAHFDIEQENALGLKFVSVYAQKLGGELNVGDGAKTVFQVSFLESLAA